MRHLVPSTLTHIIYQFTWHLVHMYVEHFKSTNWNLSLRRKVLNNVGYPGVYKSLLIGNSGNKNIALALVTRCSGATSFLSSSMPGSDIFK